MDNQINSFPTGEAPKESKGAMIGAIIIVILLILGGLYVLSNRRQTTPINVDETVVNPTTTINPNPTLASDENTAKLEADIDADLKALDADMSAMETEVGGF